jgi:hypothetical protein
LRPFFVDWRAHGNIWNYFLGIFLGIDMVSTAS